MININIRATEIIIYVFSQAEQCSSVECPFNYVCAISLHHFFFFPHFLFLLSLLSLTSAFQNIKNVKYNIVHNTWAS